MASAQRVKTLMPAAALLKGKAGDIFSLPP